MLGGMLAGVGAATFVWGLFAECELELSPGGSKLTQDIEHILGQIDVIEAVEKGLYRDRRANGIFSHWRLVDSRLFSKDCNIIFVGPVFIAKAIVLKLMGLGYSVAESNLTEYKLT